MEEKYFRAIPASIRPKLIHSHEWFDVSETYTVVTADGSMCQAWFKVWTVDKTIVDVHHKKGDCSWESSGWINGKVTHYLVEMPAVTSTLFESDMKIPDLCDRFMPNAFDLSTFKPKEIEWLRSAWHQGAQVMFHQVTSMVLSQDAIEQAKIADKKKRIKDTLMLWGHSEKTATEYAENNWDKI